MKVSKTLREKFNDGKLRYEALAADVKEHLQGKVEARGWFFTARVQRAGKFCAEGRNGSCAEA